MLQAALPHFFTLRSSLTLIISYLHLVFFSLFIVDPIVINLFIYLSSILLIYLAFLFLSLSIFRSFVSIFTIYLIFLIQSTGLNPHVWFSKTKKYIIYITIINTRAFKVSENMCHYFER